MQNVSQAGTAGALLPLLLPLPLPLLLLPTLPVPDAAESCPPPLCFYFPLQFGLIALVASVEVDVDVAVAFVDDDDDFPHTRCLYHCLRFHSLPTYK